MSHYPSTAELGSFRRAIHETAIGTPAEGCTNCPAFAHAYGAWPDERQCGIGYSGGSPTLPAMMCEADGGPFPMGYAVSCAWADAYDHSWARKAAGAMRSRTWNHAEWSFHPEGGGAYQDERESGSPVHSKCPDGCTLPYGHWGCHPID